MGGGIAWLWKDDGESSSEISPIFEGFIEFYFEGVFVEHGEFFSSCMKIGEKTITVKGKVMKIFTSFIAGITVNSPGDW